MSLTTKRLLKLHHILGDAKRGIDPLIPVSRSSWYAGVATGRYPAPVRLPGGRGAFWRSEDILALMEGGE